MSETFISSSSQETQDLAKKVLDRLKDTNVLALYGKLGSGKTTFVQGLAKALGVKDKVQSPTFTLVREYKISYKLPARNATQSVAGGKAISYKLLIHVDCYRVDSEKDLKGVSLQEYWEDKESLVVIEWAERVKDILPENRLDICFEIISGQDQARRITLFDRFIFTAKE